jgi:hypothetical protein
MPKLILTGVAVKKMIEVGVARTERRAIVVLLERSNA